MSHTWVRVETDIRSDGNIRYYEYENDKFEYLTQYTSPNPQRGVAFMPKRGINLHDNEVLRGFKTVNDSYIEPVSFIVPRRSEMFQSDIYPPTTGLRPGTTADEWFGGKTALPPKISLESVYDGEAPKEVPAESLHKPSQSISQPAPSKPTPAPTFEKPAQSSAAAPVASRGPAPSMNDNKQSLAAGASKFADKDVESDKESESSFEEVAKPVSRPTVTAARQEEKTRGPAITKEPEPEKKPTPATTFTPSEPGATLKSNEPTPSSAPAPTSAPSAGGPASALRDALSDIKSQLEHQNRVMSDQSDQIALLVRKVTQLEGRNGAHEPSDREKDERIRQLELELEEARSWDLTPFNSVRPLLMYVRKEPSRVHTIAGPSRGNTGGNTDGNTDGGMHAGRFSYQDFVDVQEGRVPQPDDRYWVGIEDGGHSLTRLGDVGGLFVCVCVCLCMYVIVLRPQGHGLLWLARCFGLAALCRKWDGYNLHCSDARVLDNVIWCPSTRDAHVHHYRPFSLSADKHQNELNVLRTDGNYYTRKAHQDARMEISCSEIEHARC
jgi:hypothetical protein